MPNMIRILVVDDHALVRDGLCRLIDGEPDMEVIGQAGTGRLAVEFCRQTRPDLVLLDYALPDMDGLEITRQIMESDPNARIIILTMYANEEYATRSIQAGASGFLVKAASVDELLGAIRKVAGKGIYVPPGIAEKLEARGNRFRGNQATESLLSDREMQVFLRLSRGFATREVAGELGLSVSTVEKYRSRILDKLNLRNNSDITRFAIRRGLVDLF
jgi:DNA-binding NarL/FixJ family response regulator